MPFEPGMIDLTQNKAVSCLNKFSQGKNIIKQTTKIIFKYGTSNTYLYAFKGHAILDLNM